MDIQELINFHIEHKFFVLVQKESEGISVAYPANIVSSPPFKSRVDVYKINKNRIEYANSDGERGHFTTNYYDARILVATDIILKTGQRNISPKLILPFDGMELKKGIKSLLKEPAKKEHKDKEEILKDKFGKILNIRQNEYGLDNAIKDGIQEGYKSIRELCAIGGIKQQGE